MTVTGPDFIALQVLDLDRAATFYETHLGLRRAPVSPPHAVVFDTKSNAGKAYEDAVSRLEGSRFDKADFGRCTPARR